MKFFRLAKDPPSYLAEGYLTPSGARMPGHEVKIIGGLPYGLGQALMIGV
ncbi:MAG TPA: hypothetical protein P5026_06740 [Kiritimatiellia bacterium]|nr:hypothetical protein [Kiritimatiellia bacterium]HRU71539.1 hypothetical protein [Kiritimatiellia bacterium]